MLAERNSLRGITRIKHTKLGTVLHWLDLAGQQAATVSSKFIHNIHLTQVQIDELWTLVKKNRATSLTGKPSPVSVITGFGERSRCPRGCASPVTSAKNAVQRQPPLLSNVYGPQVMVRRHSLRAINCRPMWRHWWPITVWLAPPPPTRGRGRPRHKPKRILDPHLCYAQVDKRREGGRVVEVRRRIIFGTAEEMATIITADGCGSTINTAYVERNNLSMRQNVGRLLRKTLSFSKSEYYLQRHIELEDAIYNFVKPHLSLRRRLQSHKHHGRKWEPRTPAMAAGLTDHIWSIEELLEFQG
jgi:hypothetical protein